MWTTYGKSAHCPIKDIDELRKSNDIVFFIIHCVSNVAIEAKVGPLYLSWIKNNNIEFG